MLPTHRNFELGPFNPFAYKETEALRLIRRICRYPALNSRMRKKLGNFRLCSIREKSPNYLIAAATRFHGSMMLYGNSTVRRVLNGRIAVYLGALEQARIKSAMIFRRFQNRAARITVITVIESLGAIRS